MRSLSMILMLIIFAFSGNSQKAVDLKKVLTKEYKKDLKKKDIVGMSLGILDNGIVAHTQGFGFENREDGTVATSSTEYKIGSISKVFTVIAIMKLQEEGKLDIDKSIKHYIPEIAIKSRFENGTDLLIRDIMSHSSGLPSDILNGMFSPEPQDFDWFIEKLNQQYMSAPPRFLMSYSNLGYGLLGELIKRTSGMSYTDYMKENVFLPLGMNSSYVFEGEESLSRAYVGNELYQPERIRDQAAGSVVSTVDDMLIFTEMLINNGKTSKGQFLSEEDINLIETNQLEKNEVGGSTQYGFGVFVNSVSIKSKKEEKEDVFIEHGGDTYAYHAHFGYLKNKGIGAVVLTNSRRGGAVNSVFRLMETYLSKTEQIELERTYSSSNAIAKSFDNPISSQEVKGKYALANFLVDVENSSKIKLDIGGSKLNLIEKKQSNSYKLKAIMMGFLPIPVSSIDMVIFRAGENTFVSQRNVKSSRNDVIGIKLQEKQVHKNWKERIGTYKIIDATDTSYKAMNLTKETPVISIENNLLKIDFSEESIFEKAYFQAEDSHMAYTIGVGRNAGYSLTVLPNGNLSFVGFELEKITK